MYYHKGTMNHYSTELLTRLPDGSPEEFCGPCFMQADFLGKTLSILIGYPRQRRANNLEKRKCFLTVKKVNRHLGLV